MTLQGTIHYLRATPEAAQTLLAAYNTYNLNKPFLAADIKTLLTKTTDPKKIDFAIRNLSQRYKLIHNTGKNKERKCEYILTSQVLTLLDILHEASQ